MNHYEELTAFLKVVYQNLGVLHHNVVGHGFFTIHPQLEEWYKYIGDMLDDLIERGIPLGHSEPSIKDAILLYSNNLLPVEVRECNESIKLAYDDFIMVVEKATVVKEDTPVDIQNKLDEYIFYLRKEADYKMQHYLGEAAASPNIIEEDD